MCIKPSGLLFTILIVLVVVAGRAFPQEEAVSLSIRFAGGTSQFHVGEVIPIELSFTASLPDTFDLSTRNYDRSGRLNIDQFHVTPPGRDPLADYYANGVVMGGGLGSSLALSSEPQLMREDLNEWVALDDPGHYTLYVSTGRASRRGSTQDEPQQLRSNSLARIIREFERQQKPLLLQTCCLDNVWVTKEASECLKIAQHSVCCSQEFFASP